MIYTFKWAYDKQTCDKIDAIIWAGKQERLVKSLLNLDLQLQYDKNIYTAVSGESISKDSFADLVYYSLKSIDEIYDEIFL